jgi:hypothetical protein
VALPEQLLLSDLLRRRVRCDQGLDHGAGLVGWMHPPVHRLLGWVSRPSAFGTRRLVWRLDQLRGLGEQEALVQGNPADTDQDTVERLPTLIEAALIGVEDRLLGTIADAAIERRSGRILHYLVARSDPRLPGSSRWRLMPERIVDQQPGRVVTALSSLDELPLARASVRQEFLRRSRRWRDQVQEETSRLRDQVQQAGGRFEERLEGWLEEPPWDAPDAPERRWRDPGLEEEDEREDAAAGSGVPRSRPARELDPWDRWEDSEVEEAAPRSARRRGGPDEDPWV